MLIRELHPDDSLEELTALLHRAYKQLADMGLRFLATHQDVETTRRRIAKGTCFVAELEGRIVGTITYNPPGMAKGSPYIEKANVGHVQQMGIEPTLQGKGIASALMRHAEQFARHHGALEMSLDTAESATHLVAWYERLEYEVIEHVQWDVTNYRSVVMGKKLRRPGPN
jgi:GNAT superfamily N-acetyltransferase